MDTLTNTRWNFIGLSTDSKPTPSNSKLVVDGSAFNSQILMPELHTVGQNFLGDCTSFAQPFTFVDKIGSGGKNIMYNCSNLTSLTVNCDPSVLNDNVYSFSTTNVSAPAYTTGVTISGTYATDFKTRFPNRDTSPYRKLI